MRSCSLRSHLPIKIFFCSSLMYVHRFFTVVSILIFYYYITTYAFNYYCNLHFIILKNCEKLDRKIRFITWLILIYLDRDWLLYYFKIWQRCTTIVYEISHIAYRMAINDYREYDFEIVCDTNHAIFFSYNKYRTSSRIEPLVVRV